MKAARNLGIAVALVGVGALSLALSLYVGRLATDPAWARSSAADALVAESAAREKVETDSKQAELDRQAAQRWAGWQASMIEPAQVMLYAAFPATGAALLASIAMLALGGAGIALYRAYLTSVPLVQPDRDGLLPVSRAALTDRTLQEAALDSLAYHHQTRRATAIGTAQRPVLPQTLTYSPHYSVKNDRPALPEPAPEPAAPEVPAARVPTFAELLAGGVIGDGQPLLLGYDASTGEALTGSWLDLYSTAVAGMSGTGKTTSQRFLAAQVALQGARFVVVDPHAGAGADSLAGTLAPLSSLFMCEPASTDKQILDAVHMVADIGKRRVAGQDRDRTPIILWLDECTSLLGRGAIKDELAELLERVAQEYRKRWVFACASGQIWTASRSGGSELRDSFASVLCHRMKRAQARLLLPLEEAQTVERLATGSAVLWRTSGESAVVRVPNTTQADIEGVARLLNGFSVNAPSNAPSWSPSKAPSLPDYSVTVEQAFRAAPSIVVEGEREGAPEALDARAARVRALMLEGMTPTQIIKELWGQTSGAGYQKAAGELNEILRRLIAGAL